MSLKVPVENNTFHVVCQNIPRNPHIAKCVKDSDEQIFLLGVGKKLYLLLAAVMTYHNKTGSIGFIAVVIYHFSKSPIHLLSFSRFGCEYAAPVTLWYDQLTLGWDEMFVR